MEVETNKTFLSLCTTTSDRINNLDIKNGQIIFIRDSERIAFDYKDERLYYSQFINKHGEITAPVMLSDLDNGIYLISGQYQIGGDLETIFDSSQKVMFLIESDENNKYITKLGANGIDTYVINLISNEVKFDKYATQSWVLSQRYTSEDYVTKAIKNLYEQLKNEIVVPTKMSDLENDVGYLKSGDLSNVNSSDITGLF
jgi:hypothetical protein|uniref:Uncharacterized protein n=1 Tax=virus sp. ctmTa7 TaxID=2828255 RepID=A0A8S5RBR4_9VIRU|nr:MAG TPA: hypothetical protein [virus sp. ctmTa7]DAU18416.1 MAG TPA: hypothetical protein [Bacteriophage sp.]